MTQKFANFVKDPIFQRIIDWISVDGSTSAQSEILTENRQPLYGEVRTIKKKECQQVEKPGYKRLTDSHLCAIGDQDTCSGDSGGPLVCQTKHGRSYLAGITSFGLADGFLNFWKWKNLSKSKIFQFFHFLISGSGLPGIYTRVSEYEDWLVEYIQNN